MKLTDKINLFVEKKEVTIKGEKKTFVHLTTSISTKDKDGKYVRFTMEVKLKPKKFGDDKLLKLDEGKMYTADLISAWLSVDTYVRNGVTTKKLIIFVDEMKLIDAKLIDQEKRTKALESAKKPQEQDNPDLPW